MRKFYKKCGCGGDPTCYSCRGTDKVPDRETDLEYADYMHDVQKDEKYERDHDPHYYDK